MKHRYLEVTFRDGRPVAGYLYLARSPGDVSVRTERREAGLIIDFSADGRAIGIEITSPRNVTIAAIDRVLRELHEAPVSAAELAPLLAA